MSLSPTTIHVFDISIHVLILSQDQSLCGATLQSIFASDDSYLRLGEEHLSSKNLCPECSNHPKVQMRLLSEVEL